MYNFFSSFDAGTQLDVAFLDISKAFDIVPNKGNLLHKRSHYGINGTTLSWLESLLINKTTRVVLDVNKAFREYTVGSGVPQGTVLAPLLVLSHVKDFINIIIIIINREGRWGTTDDFTTNFLHFPLFSTALWDLPNSRPVHTLMLSSHLFHRLPLTSSASICR